MRGRTGRWVLLPLLAAVFIGINPPAIAQADWVHNKFGWQYQENDGSYPASAWKELNGVWYYFKDTGYMVSGPLAVDGVQYYFHSSGAMASAEWIEFRGEWYYFNQDGSLARSSWIGDLYYVDEKGIMVEDRMVDGVYIDEHGVAEHPGDDR